MFSIDKSLYLHLSNYYMNELDVNDLDDNLYCYNLNVDIIRPELKN